MKRSFPCILLAALLSMSGSVSAQAEKPGPVTTSPSFRQHSAEEITIKRIKKKELEIAPCKILVIADTVNRRNDTSTRSRRKDFNKEINPL